MGIQLSTSEMEVLHKLQRNLGGNSDNARVTYILMLGMGSSPSFVASCLGIDVSTVYRYRSAYLQGGLMDFRKTVTKVIGGFLTAASWPPCTRNCKRIYTDTKSGAAWIKSTFGVEYPPPIQGGRYSCHLTRRTSILLRSFGNSSGRRSSIPGFTRRKRNADKPSRVSSTILETIKEELESLPTPKHCLCNSQTISF